MRHENLLISQACLIAKHGDFMSCMVVGQKQDFVFWNNQILTLDHRAPCFVSEHFKTDTWNITQPELKVLTAEESWNKSSLAISYPEPEPNMAMSFNAGHLLGKVQGRLERDLEVRPFMQAVQHAATLNNFEEIDTRKYLIDLIKKLPPLKAE